MALTSVPYSQTPDRILNQIQTYIINPLNVLITSFNAQPTASISSGVFTVTPAGSPPPFISVPNLTASITATGRPIRIELLPDGSLGNASYIEISKSGSQEVFAYLQLSRDNTPIAAVSFGQESVGASGSAFTIPPSAFSFVDDAATNGLHTYSIQVKNFSGETISVNYIILRVSQE